jgi:hypothetical protein
LAKSSSLPNRALAAWLAPCWTQIEGWLERGERFVEVR